MTVLTNPSSIDHAFDYNSVNRLDTYTPPLSGSYVYAYDRDLRLTAVTYPSGRVISNVWANGRLVSTQTPEGDIDYAYSCSSIVSAITKGGESIGYTNDGPLVTAETLSGTLNQAIAYTYNNDFNVDSITYAGGTTALVYDADDLLVGVGAYAITSHFMQHWGSSAMLSEKRPARWRRGDHKTVIYDRRSYMTPFFMALNGTLQILYK